MVTTSDKLRGITWYNHKRNPETRRNKWFGLYIAEVKGEYIPFIFINYFADDWLFIGKYLIGADDQVFTVEPLYAKVERDNAGGSVWEWFQRPLTQSDLEMIEAVIQSQDATLRYVGAQYYSEREISSDEKSAMGVTLAAFEELGGNLYEIPNLGD